MSVVMGSLGQVVFKAIRTWAISRFRHDQQHNHKSCVIVEKTAARPA